MEEKNTINIQQWEKVMYHAQAFLYFTYFVSVVYFFRRRNMEEEKVFLLLYENFKLVETRELPDTDENFIIFCEQKKIWDKPKENNSRIEFSYP